jgi:hypothetical protein
VESATELQASLQEFTASETVEGRGCFLCGPRHSISAGEPSLSPIIPSAGWRVSLPSHSQMTPIESRTVSPDLDIVRMGLAEGWRLGLRIVMRQWKSAARQSPCRNQRSFPQKS